MSASAAPSPRSYEIGFSTFIYVFVWSDRYMPMCRTMDQDLHARSPLIPYPYLLSLSRKVRFLLKFSWVVLQLQLQVSPVTEVPKALTFRVPWSSSNFSFHRA